MTAAIPFTWVDVFADGPLKGNQLCLFQVDDGFPAEWMERITRELNHSETVFLQPGGRIRIFMSNAGGGHEIPFAGHPIVGAAAVAAGAQSRRVTLMTGVGPIGVDVTREGPDCWRSTMDQPVPRTVWVGACRDGVPRPDDGARLLSRTEVAQALGIGAADLRTDLPVEAVDNGMATVIVPLADRDGLRRAAPDVARLRSLFGLEGRCVLLFVPAEAGSGGDVRCRVFCPYEAVTEDPATGSANGPLGEYLVRHGAVAGPVVISLQGEEIARPSRLRIEVSRSGSITTGVKVGGQVWQIGAGEFRLQTL